ncbi:hypothetical protein HYFRA_00005489 [Hymenoscyphus fraxineus]|uniref:Histone-lysine N-methyltransferase SET9 n=1 Tax=Hymenoscyphus fraxineus TaxID=746836 RepID=A0A9N9KPV5_9HELO|nr:hypothetical protein HYFRA_00005489 [Hymenoscyphus fraxineus]
MPPNNVAPKHRLTLAQITSYDDMLTDALVDHVYYWTRIRKNKSAYHPSRGISEDVVAKIIQTQVIIAKDTAQAEKQLLELPGLARFLQNLKTDKEKEDFRKHLRKYINIYLPDCPFEVATTNRYTIDTHEAAVIARRDIKRGQVVKYLCGIQVIMTEDEEEMIKSSRRDFSIVVSSRNKAASLFLGPARFANHDCGANAKLMTSGSAGMEIIAVRDIDIGEEITVTYGDNYFGEDNCECLCNTCEKNCTNGWSHGKVEETGDAPKPSIENGSPSKGYSLRARRRLDSETPSSRNQSETPDLNVRPHVPKATPRSLSRFKNGGTPAGTSPSAEPKPRGSNLKRKSLLKTESSIENTGYDEQNEPSAKRRKTDVQNPSPLSEEASGLESIKMEEQPSVLIEVVDYHPSPITPVDESRRASVSTTAEDGHTSTDATSVDEDTIVVELPPSLTAAIPMAKNPELPHPGPMEQAEAGETIIVGESTSVEHPAVDSGIAAEELAVSERESIESTENQEECSGSPKNGRKRSIEDDTSSKDDEPVKKKRKRGVSPAEIVRPPRIPGDYVLTASLLAHPTAAWIRCKVDGCKEFFVQDDAYFTKSSCPRCERHSKLYGFRWPKTDKDGRHDSEERVLDHRTVHRFIEPAEERIIRKRGSGSGSRDSTRETTEIPRSKPAKPAKVVKPSKPARSTKSAKAAKPVKTPKAVKSTKTEKSKKSENNEQPARRPYKRRAATKPISLWEISDDEEEEDEEDESVIVTEEDEAEDSEPEIRSRRDRNIKKVRRTM